MATSRTALKKVPELWFEDGNVIIISGNKAFRVYRGIIASRSPVLREMLNTPQSSDPMSAVTNANVKTVSMNLQGAPPTPPSQDGADRIVIDGVQQVDSSDVFCLLEPGDDVEQFFKELFGISPIDPEIWRSFPGSYVSSEQHLFTRNVRILTSILRLAKKYDVGDLKKRCVHLLECLFSFRSSMSMQFHNVDHYPWRGLLPLLQAVLDAGVPWFAPGIFVATRLEKLDNITADADWESLSETTKCIYLTARAKHVLYSTYHMFSIAKAWKARSPCAEKKCAIAYNRFILESVPAYAESGERTSYQLFRNFTKSLCSECSDSLETHVYKKREHEWKMVPSILGLESWEDLESNRKDFLA